MGASFWEDRPAKPLYFARGKPRPNPLYRPDPKPQQPTLRVSVRADLLDRAADLIAESDPSLSALFKKMVREDAT